MAGAYPFKDGASIFSPAAHGLDLGPALATFAGHQPVILNLLAGAGIFGGMIWILVAVPTGGESSVPP